MNRTALVFEERAGDAQREVAQGQLAVAATGAPAEPAGAATPALAALPGSPFFSTTRAIALAWSESLGTVRSRSPLSGKSSSDSADAVGEHVRTPSLTLAPSVVRRLTDDVGPMMASTPSWSSWKVSRTSWCWRIPRRCQCRWRQSPERPQKYGPQVSSR